MIRTRPVEELLGPFFLQMSITRMFDNNRQVNISDRVLLFISLRVIYIYFYFIPFFVGGTRGWLCYERAGPKPSITAVYANAGIYRDHTRSWHVGVSHRHHPSSTRDEEEKTNQQREKSFFPIERKDGREYTSRILNF